MAKPESHANKQQAAEEIVEQRLRRKREIARLMGAFELSELRKPKPDGA